MKYTWNSFKRICGKKLMNYRNSRSSLLSLVYENNITFSDKDSFESFSTFLNSPS